ncbi:winged helix-turn-helix transcriptional regulator [Nocardia sp. NPDC052278]|uniref:winged helix-turn-helix transcriptional regulator n=1 Tax=unclassified Nocardia TaxID=2637762 RepID=UPI0036A7413E
MHNRRTYGEACAAAHALDLTGDRWALLIVRELLFGPKRFSDLRAGLPSIAPNRLAQRLRDLEQHAILQRRTLGPPVGSQVYELTDWGRDLEPVLVELGRWGRRSPFRDLDAHLSVDSLMLALRSDFRPRPDSDLHGVYRFHFGNDQFTVRVSGTGIEVGREATTPADVTVISDLQTFVSLLTRRHTIPDALATGRLSLSGDSTALQDLFDVFPRPTSSVQAD